MIFPLIQEIPYQDPLPVFAKFATTQAAVFLDSASREICGRYSFIAVDPFQTLTSKNSAISLQTKEFGEQLFAGDPFLVLAEQLASFPLRAHPELPPFQGGVAGYLGYELYQHLEKIPARTNDDMQFADMALGFYDVVMGFDHEAKRAWIFSSGYPARDAALRGARARERCEWMLSETKNIPALAAQVDAVCLAGEIKANFSQQTYQAAVREVIDYILAGDIFEANIAQRFMAQLPRNLSPFQLYRRLRLLNPAPFAAYLSFNDTVIASASPERFLKVSQNNVEARPIKGTRKRGTTEELDRQLARELLHCEKDRAENVMIVDLLRNDLSRVCEDHSVKVSQLCGLESYATVHHLVSVVTGRLRENFNALDLLRVAFPGGSITGAPKVRAMEIIAELEPTRRGPYCGSVAYIGFNGDMDSSIIIRTYAIKNNIVTFQAGGAVVMDSGPAAEYAETLTKAQALRNALLTAPEKYMILLIDNYDSFVYNLARYVGELGHERCVRRNDAISLADIAALNPSHIIISPGPCAPDQAGISMDVVRTFGQRIPILGVCLGHQAIGQVYGGKVTRAKNPMHGKSSLITHDGKKIFSGLENPLQAARYHSLVVADENFPPELEITARSAEAEVMALSHRDYPVFGVQFHPESVLTQGGHALLKNFLD